MSDPTLVQGIAAALFVEGVGKSEVVLVAGDTTQRKRMTLYLAKTIVGVSKLSIKQTQKQLFPERYTYKNNVSKKQKTQ